MDDLKRFTEASLHERRREVSRVQGIVIDELERYRIEGSAREVAPLVVALRDKGEEIRTSELARFRARLDALEPSERRAVEALTKGIVNKLLHDPTVQLKGAAGTARGELYADAVAALFFFSWKRLIVAVVLYWLTGGLGLGVCFHRLLTHRSFATPKWMEYFLTICGVAALEGGPLLWVANHRRHHQFADKEGDPHSPRDGKWWSHMGWITSGKSLHRSTEELAPYARDLMNDRFHVWISRWHWVPLTVSRKSSALLLREWWITRKATANLSASTFRAEMAA